MTGCMAALKNPKSPDDYYMESVYACLSSAIRNFCSGLWTLPSLRRFVRRTLWA